MRCVLPVHDTTRTHKYLIKYILGMNDVLLLIEKKRFKPVIGNPAGVYE